MATKTMNPDLVAEKKRREIVTTFEGLVEALGNEAERLRAVDIYLNDEGCLPRNNVFDDVQFRQDVKRILDAI